ncbi:MAG TPA: hypothetical protein P5280_18385 [Cyclobacteriaceae bacterium]|nr:hypothetical protein [Cyclobacteriaceae bacterium]
MSEIFDFDAHIEHVISGYRGDATTLGNAIGALVLGRYVGWRVVRVVYSNSTYTKYQKILGIQFKDVLPERSRYSYKSLGLFILDKAGKFWDFVRSSSHVPDLANGRRSMFE